VSVRYRRSASAAAGARRAPHTGGQNTLLVIRCSCASATHCSCRPVRSRIATRDHSPSRGRSHYALLGKDGREYKTRKEELKRYVPEEAERHTSIHPRVIQGARGTGEHAAGEHRSAAHQPEHTTTSTGSKSSTVAAYPSTVYEFLGPHLSPARCSHVLAGRSGQVCCRTWCTPAHLLVTLALDGHLAVCVKGASEGGLCGAGL
jgi:hypothetical protein